MKEIKTLYDCWRNHKALVSDVDPNVLNAFIMPHPMTEIKKNSNFLDFLDLSQEREIIMLLKVAEQSSTGVNTKFVNVKSGRRVTLEHAIKQIDNGNKNYSNYQTVRNSNGTVYIRLKADGKRNNNIE